MPKFISRMKKCTWLACVLALAMCVCGCAQADGYSVIRKMIVDTLQLEINVQNSHGQPLAGAVVWYFGYPDKNSRLNKSDFERMGNRYIGQNDYLNLGDIPKTIFVRTNMRGSFFDVGHEYTGDSEYKYILVATKRGYLPQVIEGAAPLNRKHLVQFKLAPDPQARIDSRMETFDQIMAQARNTAPDEDVMGEARMHKLEKLEQQLRQLAHELEKDKFDNEASAIYWALADFPSVTRMTTADGQQKITGYANGRQGPAAEVDRLKATQLNTCSPKLLLSKMMLQQGYPRVGIKTEAQGQAYLAAFEQMANSEMKEQLLPGEYETAIYQMIKWSTPDKACELINKAYVFEPAAMPLKGWWARIKDVERQQQRLGLPMQVCVIPGLPAFSGK